MKKETLPLLCAPGSHESLKAKSLTDSNGITQEYLIGIKTGKKYLVRDGIPLLIADDIEITGFNRRYQKFYDRVAGMYDAAIRFVAKLAGSNEETSRKNYLKELEPKPAGKILEVSVGTGANFRYLPHDAEFFGLDLSWGMLQKCRKNLKNWEIEADLVFGNAEDLPFKNNTFDSVLHVGGINAFNDRKKAIEEMIRVAKPGCKIVIADETFKTVNSIRWIPGTKKIIKQFGERLSAPADLVPKTMKNIEVKSLAGGYLYCLTFRKPGVKKHAGDAIKKPRKK